MNRSIQQIDVVLALKEAGIDKPVRELVLDAIKSIQTENSFNPWSILEKERKRISRLIIEKQTLKRELNRLKASYNNLLIEHKNLSATNKKLSQEFLEVKVDEDEILEIDINNLEAELSKLHNQAIHDLGCGTLHNKYKAKVS